MSFRQLLATLEPTENPPVELVFLASASATAGDCKATPIQRRDSSGAPTQIDQDTIVTLTGNGAGDFYSASDCNGASIITGTTIVSGQHTSDVYFKTTLTGAYSLQAVSGALNQAQVPVTVAPAPATAFNLVSGDTQTGTVGSALASPYVVELSDTYGNPVVGVSVGFAVTGGGGSIAATATTNALGQASATHTLGTVSGTAQTAQATYAALTPIDFSATANPGAATQLSITGPATVGVNTCATTAVVIERRDVHGNLAPDAGALALTATGVPTTDGGLYTASDCSGSADNTPSIAAGQSSVTLYYASAISFGASDLTITAGAMSDALNISVTGLWGSPVSLDLSAGIAAPGIALGDLDLDGDLDIVAIRGASEIRRYLNNGSGSFGASSSIALGGFTTARGITLGDFNHDARLDLIASFDNGGSGTTRIYLGNGSGGFGAASAAIATTESPQGIAVGDIDLDGNLDIAVAVSNGTDLARIALGNGTGGFGAPSDYSVASGSLFKPELVDVNLDGKLDLISPASGVAVRLGDGSGTFAAAVIAGSGTNYTKAVIADYNRNGKPDIGALSPTAIQFFSGNGTDTFAAATNMITGLTATSDFLANDYDYDGDLDIAFPISTGAGKLAVYTNNGSMTFTRSEYASADGPTLLAEGDLNRDGENDLITGNANSIGIQAHGAFSRPGTFGTFSVMAAGGSSTTRFSVPLDLNKDGWLDFASVGSGGTEVAVRLANGVGGWNAATGYNVAAAGNIFGVNFGDLNRDGHLDVVTGNGIQATVSVAFGDGLGAFGAGTEYATEQYPGSIQLADLDRDGDLDVIVANRDISNTDSTDTISVFLNDGSGGMGSATHYGVTGSPQAVYVQDFDLDGDQDIMMGCRNGAIHYFAGDGSGTFGAPASFGTTNNLSDLQGADLDRDGDIDVVSTHSLNDTINVLRNNRNGTFTMFSLGTDPSPTSIGLIDYDHDGFIDIGASSTTGSPHAFLIRLGSGVLNSFATATSFFTAGGTGGMRFGDLNRDGVQDMAFGSTTSGIAYSYGAP